MSIRGWKYYDHAAVIIKIVYPFRKAINKESRLGNKISAVLVMEEIKRSFQSI